LPTLHQKHFFGSDGDFVPFFVFGGDYGDDLMGDFVESVIVGIGIGIIVFVAMTSEEGQDFGTEYEFGCVISFLVGLCVNGCVFERGGGDGVVFVFVFVFVDASAMLLHRFGFGSSALFAVGTISNAFQCLTCQFLHGLYGNDAFVTSLIFVLVVGVGISSNIILLTLLTNIIGCSSTMTIPFTMTMMRMPSLRIQPMLMILQFRHPLPRTELPLDAIILFPQLHPQLGQNPLRIEVMIPGGSSRGMSRRMGVRLGPIALQGVAGAVARGDGIVGIDVDIGSGGSSSSGDGGRNAVGIVVVAVMS